MMMMMIIIIIIVITIISTEQRTSREACSFSVSQEISCVLWDLSFSPSLSARHNPYPESEEPSSPFSVFF